MSRCIAYHKNKKCRKKINENDFFCCKEHYPLNKEIIDEGCFICSEKIKNNKELYYFRCNHAFHRECYDEWCKYSNYNTTICMICRNEVLKKPIKLLKIRNHGVLNTNEYKKINNILKIIQTSI